MGVIIEITFNSCRFLIIPVVLMVLCLPARNSGFDMNLLKEPEEDDEEDEEEEKKKVVKPKKERKKTKPRAQKKDVGDNEEGPKQPQSTRKSETLALNFQRNPCPLDCFIGLDLKA